MDPTAADAQSRYLRIALKNRRIERDLTPKQICSSLGWPVSTLLDFEAGATKLTIQELGKAARHLELDLGQGAAGPRSNYSVQFGADIDVNTAQYFELEHAAHTIRSYEALLVPGLLQSEEYAWRTFRTVFELPRRTAFRRLEARMKRQLLLYAGGPTDFQFVLDATILERLETDGVGRRQLELLRGLSSFSHVSVRILPATASLHASLSGPFIHLAVDHAFAEALYLEDPRGFSHRLQVGASRETALYLKRFRAMCKHSHDLNRT